MIVTRGLGPAPSIAVSGLGPLLIDIIYRAGIMALYDLPTARILMGDNAYGGIVTTDE